MAVWLVKWPRFSLSTSSDNACANDTFSLASILHWCQEPVCGLPAHPAGEGDFFDDAKLTLGNMSVRGVTGLEPNWHH
jgi:hypothetical protein